MNAQKKCSVKIWQKIKYLQGKSLEPTKSTSCLRRKKTKVHTEVSFMEASGKPSFENPLCLLQKGVRIHLNPVATITARK